uniref:Phage portal protein, PBSX family n=1 Tax=Candidatus Kentrum sp. FM TaxID=2126340 RepID=A0A450RV02_9GAMM|nr:MAG: phage portal protein, PBSX family [Candidatus Kentron sp. FM]VFJ43618.1 MAG: phage portal protein, PBSX family [Candidatus Kentron sp. FM]VFK05638.1 MAG: phage portal protein, PBSX family [Candidatus Kentron sp. FM]
MTEPKQENITVFAFGDPEPVLENRWWDWIGVFPDTAGEYYHAPVEWKGVAQLIKINPYHASAIEYRLNQTMRWWADHSLIGRKQMRYGVMDLLVFENAYFQIFRNGFGKPTRFERLPAMAMRVGTKPGIFYRILEGGETVQYRKGEVVHLHGTDVLQSIYGVPWYLAALQAILMGEDTVLFRRKFYRNGAHAGTILVTSGLTDQEAGLIEEKLKTGDGFKNFGTLYVNFPKQPQIGPGAGRTTAKNIELIPVGGISGRDDIKKIAEISREQIMAIHRINPALTGIMPSAQGGYGGDIDKIQRIDYENETQPRINVIKELNEYLPDRYPVKFGEPG